MNLNDLKSNFVSFKDLPYRPAQEEVINFALNSDKKFIIVEAPTGSGKSLCGMSICAGTPGGQSIYAVHTKALQAQLNRDFPEAVILFGRDNYGCIKYDSKTCAQCTATKTHPCEVQYRCTYKVLKKEAIASRFKVLNYSMLLSEANFVGQFSGNELIVIDEADSLDKALYDFITITINDKQLKKLDIGLPNYKTACDNGILDWKRWAGAVSVALNTISLQHTREIEGWDVIESQWQIDYMKEHERINDLRNKFGIFLKYVDKDWIYEEKDVWLPSGTIKTFTFKPLWLNETITDLFLWRHAKKFVLLSATFPPPAVISKVLGIPRDEIDYTVIPTQFPAENRRAIIVPVASMIYKDMEAETPKMVEAVKLIVQHHEGEKGLIHTVSYKLRDRIMDLGNTRFITHGPKDKIEQLEFFRNSKKPLVFVSPSSERGISLDDDLCRFIILCKAPFLSLGDKGVKLRVYSGQVGQLWYTADMLLTVVQALGRGNRSMTDWCVSYLLDEQIEKAIIKKPSIMPGWFRDALEFEDWDVLRGRLLEGKSGGR